jgi:hypothetical protein
MMYPATAPLASNYVHLLGQFRYLVGPVGASAYLGMGGGRLRDVAAPQHLGFHGVVVETQGGKVADPAHGFGVASV